MTEAEAQADFVRALERAAAIETQSRLQYNGMDSFIDSIALLIIAGRLIAEHGARSGSSLEHILVGIERHMKICQITAIEHFQKIKAAKRSG